MPVQVVHMSYYWLSSFYSLREQKRSQVFVFIFFFLNSGSLVCYSQQLSDPNFLALIPQKRCAYHTVDSSSYFSPCSVLEFLFVWFIFSGLVLQCQSSQRCNSSQHIIDDSVVCNVTYKVNFSGFFFHSVWLANLKHL